MVTSPKGKGKCFVIGPIGEPGTTIRHHSDLVFEDIVTPVVAGLGYDPVRADLIGEPGLITHQIVDLLTQAPLVVADLSGGNPNVFYELAVRHAVEKPAVCLITPGERSPFDTTDVRAIPLHLDVRGAKQTMAELRSQIEAHEKDPELARRNPVSVARDLMELRGSPKDSDQIVAELAAKLDSLTADVTALRREAEDRAKATKLFNLAGRSFSDAYRDLEHVSLGALAGKLGTLGVGSGPTIVTSDVLRSFANPSALTDTAAVLARAKALTTDSPLDTTGEPRRRNTSDPSIGLPKEGKGK